MYGVFHNCVFKLNLNNNYGGILSHSVLQNHPQTYGWTLPICRMQTEFEHRIHQKYFEGE